MTTELIMVDVNDPISRVADLCIVHRVRRVPVMKNGRLVGVIARRDVLRALVETPEAVCSA
jgi:CBS domain-containing protein